jgi:uncharacterized protein (TIGR02452 family)
VSHSRSKAAQIARETVDILHAGRYTTPAGHVVDLGDALRAAADGTVGYPPDAQLPRVVPGGRATRYEVRNETTLAAARRLHAAGHRVVALNFASARHPGGGFLNGARAQEESLCRASGLYACLNNHPMYRHHAPMPGGMYTDYAIYSPDVPVFRDDAGDLLDEPYPCSFITCPAVNAGAVRAGERPRIIPEMAERVGKVLAVAAGHSHDAVVLGAWGCGVFKNDPEVVADLFREALVTRFAGAFDVAAFAVLDSSADRYFLGPFAARFGGPT